MLATPALTHRTASALSGIGYLGKSEQQSLDSHTDEISNDAIFRQFLLRADPVTLSDYFVSLVSTPRQETSTLRRYQPVHISPLSAAAPISLVAEVLPDVQLGSAHEAKEYISLAQAVLRQSAIHKRLKQEIEDGLEAETRYWKQFDDDSTES